MNYCTNCGSQIQENATFCGKCGTKSAAAQYADTNPATSDTPATPAALQYATPSHASYTPAKSSKTGMIIGIVFGALAVVGLAVYFLILHPFGTGTHRNRPISESDIVDLTISDTLLSVNGDSFTSISPSGNYAILGNHSNDMQIFRYHEGEYEFYTNTVFPYDEERYSFMLNSYDISWSNNEESFAFGSYRALQLGRDLGGIYVCDIDSGQIRNLSGFNDRTLFEAMLDGGEIYFDYLPVWSDDDKSIYFARYGASGGIIAGIFSIPASGGDIETIHLVNDIYDETPGTVMPPMFMRNNALFYINMPSNLSNPKTGINKFENDSENMLIRHSENKPFPFIMDVSADGRYILYELRGFSLGLTPSDITVKKFLDTYGSIYFIAETDASDDALPLLSNELDSVNPDALFNTAQHSVNIKNALFSPCGQVVLIIEQGYDFNETNIYAADVSDPVGTKRLVYTHYDGDPLVGAAHDYNTSGMQHPIWLENGFIVMNSSNGNFLLEVNLR